MLEVYTQPRSTQSLSTCFLFGHCTSSVPSLATVSAILVLLIFAQISLVSTASAQNCQYSPDWGQNGELWDPNGPLKDFSHVGYRGGDVPIPYQTRPITYGPGRYVITNRLFLGSGQVLRGAGMDKTVLYFPYPLRQIGKNECPSGDNNCYGWAYGVIQITNASGVGIEDLTIEFPTHSYTHNGNYAGWNGFEFRNSDNSWAKNVKIINSDAGAILSYGHHITLDGVQVIANPNGSHYHMVVSGAPDVSPTSLNHLITNFRVGGSTNHGMAGNWSGDWVVFSNGAPLPGTSGIELQPNHNGPGTTTFLWSNIQGQISGFNLWTPNSYVWNVGNQNLCPVDIYLAQLAKRIGGPRADAGPSHTVNVGDPVTLNGQGSSDPNGDPLTYHWDFDDGTTATGAVVTHTYAASGMYTVTLTVSDGVLTDTDTVIIAVNGHGGSPCLDANLARCATASASSAWSAGYEATKATDGNGDTRWNSASGDTDGAWLMLDFGAPTTIDTIVLKEAINRVTGYALQYWDGSTWHNLAAGAGIGAMKTHTFAAVTAEWMRLLVTSTVSHGDTGTPTIAEFEVYDSTDTACRFANLARCATASASSVWSAGYEASKANDGNGSTRWNSASGQTAGAWLALDFGTLTDVSGVVLKEAINRITGYRLQYWDGSVWRDIVSGSSIGANKAHSFATLTVQRVRLLVTSTVSNSSTGTPTIAEFEVY